jgi:hypothetical protein
MSQQSTTTSSRTALDPVNHNMTVVHALKMDSSSCASNQARRDKMTISSLLNTNQENEQYGPFRLYQRPASSNSSHSTQSQQTPPAYSDSSPNSPAAGTGFQTRRSTSPQWAICNTTREERLAYRRSGHYRTDSRSHFLQASHQEQDRALQPQQLPLLTSNPDSQHHVSLPTRTSPTSYYHQQHVSHHQQPQDLRNRSSPSPGRRGSVNTTRQRRDFRPTYQPEEEYFIWFHRDDLGLDWSDIRSAYNQWFPPSRAREGFQGIQCKYYRCCQMHGVPKVRARDRAKERGYYGMVKNCPGLRFRWMDEHLRAGEFRRGREKLEWPLTTHTDAPA